MVVSPELGRLLSAADVFLISGFNTVRDGAALDARRLADLRRHMRRLPSRAVVVFEDAGYHFPSMSARVRDALGDRIDIYGLNEDELKAYVGHDADLLGAREIAAARYLHGDAFCRALEGLPPGEVRCVPADLLSTPTPTTVGLGDAFAGGLIAALARA